MSNTADFKPGEVLQTIRSHLQDGAEPRLHVYAGGETADEHSSFRLFMQPALTTDTYRDLASAAGSRVRSFGDSDIDNGLNSRLADPKWSDLQRRMVTDAQRCMGRLVNQAFRTVLRTTYLDDEQIFDLGSEFVQQNLVINALLGLRHGTRWRLCPGVFFSPAEVAKVLRAAMELGVPQKLVPEALRRHRYNKALIFKGLQDMRYNNVNG